LILASFAVNRPKQPYLCMLESSCRPTFIKVVLMKRLYISNHNNFYVDVDSGTLIMLILFIVTPIIIVATLFYKFLAKRKRMPTVVSILDEPLRRMSTTSSSSQARDKGESRVQQMINRIHEIERKIEIVKTQNISEEAKNITIRELEEEKRMLEEEIKKFKTNVAD